MSKVEKAKKRLLSIPKDYTYDEVRALLGQLGFQELNKGKTSGSRVEFFRKSDGRAIALHKPHPGNTILPAKLAKIVKALRRYGDL